MIPIAILQMRLMFGGKKLLILGGLLSIPVLLTLLIVSTGPAGEAPNEMYLMMYLLFLFPQVICLLLGIFHGTSILGSEMEAKTLTYLFTRPIPRWKILVGKFLAVVASLSIPVVACAIACWLTLGGKGGFPLIAAVSIVIVASLAAYTALFALAGTLFTRRAMITGLLIGALYEFPFSFFDSGVSAFTAIRHLRVMAFKISGLEMTKTMTVMLRGETLAVALLALAGITIGSLVLASLVADRKEFVMAEQV